jgi:hypothetical protein
MSIRLSLTMIVKDEAATLGRCLTSVRDPVDVPCAKSLRLSDAESVQ